MKNIKLFVTFVASLFFLFSCEKEKVETCGFDTIRLTDMQRETEWTTI